MNLLNTHSHLTDHLLQSEHILTCTDCNSLYNALAFLVLMTVLPNSTLGITSLLCVAYSKIPLTDMDIRYMKAMVKEVNGTEVAPDEVLSDNVYRYDIDTDRIEMM